MEFILIGASGHAKVIYDILRLNQVDITGFFDDVKTSFKDISFLGTIDSIFDYDNASLSDKLFIVAVGNNVVRKQIVAKLKKKQLHYGNVIHPSAVIAENSIIGSGNVIAANTVIGVDSKIGNHVIINTGATVDHENTLGDYVHISPGAHLAGEVTIEDGVHIGIGANCLQQRYVGAWTVVGGGSLINKDLPEHVLAYGVPAIVKKEGINL